MAKRSTRRRSRKSPPVPTLAQLNDFLRPDVPLSLVAKWIEGIEGRAGNQQLHVGPVARAAIKLAKELSHVADAVFLARFTGAGEDKDDLDEAGKKIDEAADLLWMVARRYLSDIAEADGTLARALAGDQHGEGADHA